MTKTHKDGVISVRLSGRTLARLKRIKDEDGRHVSEFVRLAVIRALDREERDKRGVANGA